MNMPSEEQILKEIKASPGRDAREIASSIGVDKKAVNSILHGKLKGHVWQDKEYRWYPNHLRQQESERVERYANTPLSRLARYYLACIGQDEGRVSAFAASRHELDYVELEKLPSISDGRIFHKEGVRQLLGKVRQDRSRLAMYLGYPCTLRFIRSNKSEWSGYLVEPLFLFPVELDLQSGAQPKIDLTFPIISQSVLKRFTKVKRGKALMGELVQLEDELGLDKGDEPLELDDLAYRLSEVRSEWPWKEECAPNNLKTDPPLAQMNEEGIYNRAVLIVAERSSYTQGLESELKALAKLKEEQYQNTALGQWVSRQIPETEDESAGGLIEVLPLNSEQRNAVHQALNRNLTVITGPPGTGKSQVVTDLLINAAWKKKCVLFASKNNKAVDVVEVRVNNLSARPILLRVGSNQYQAKLAQYLLSLLSATSTADDQATFDESWKIHRCLEDRLKRLEDDLEGIVKLCNQVDELERAVEDARQAIPETFAFLKDCKLEEIESVVTQFQNALHNATRAMQPFLTRLFWELGKKARFEKLAISVKPLGGVAEKLAVSLPENQPSEDFINQWHEFGRALADRINLAERIRKYIKTLRCLQDAKSIESINREQAGLISELANNAERLWENWLRLQPSKLSKSDRGLLSQYRPLLRMVIETGPNAQLGEDVYKKYVNLFSKVAHLLPCWAVTSLSARGKLPFMPGFFDLVVFDEASQCDIASALPLLYRAKRVAVIGDPKQLPHISSLRRGQDQQLLGKHGLVAGHANWAYSYNSLFDLAAGMAAGDTIVSLRDHHRSHADIIEFSNQFFYEKQLRVATNYERLMLPANGDAGVRWIHVSGKVRRPDTGGAMNPPEAEAIVEALRRLVVQGYLGTVGVVSPFRAQADLIRQMVSQDKQLEQRLANADFLVDTVHKFQGDERDVMVFSPVLSDGISSGAIDFLRNNGNLFNVAITRARAMLLVVGDRSKASQSGVEYLRKFADYVESLDQEHHAHREQRLDDLGPQYPEVPNPKLVSGWEKVLYSALYKAGIPTLPQYQVEKYKLDLAVFDGGRKLDVEVDGERYHKDWTGELCRRDQIRNHRMFELGWDVMRFWVYEVRDDLDRCVSKVQEWVNGNE